MTEVLWVGVNVEGRPRAFSDDCETISIPLTIQSS